jgi:nucleotidyltransferase substrate binding protein (TIGR01987 family)
MEKILTSKMGQKFENLKKAYKSLDTAQSTPIVDARDIGGIIKAFEIVYELSWRLLKIFILQDGLDTAGPKDVFRKAYSTGWISDEKLWLEIIEDRNNTVHTYDEAFAKEIVDRIQTRYIQGFLELISKFDTQIKK